MIRGSRLRRAGYILDGNVEKITKLIYESLTEEIRLIGDQKVWEDQVHKDMQKIGLGEEDAIDRKIVGGF